jgi:hypothetical protein
MMSTSTFGWLDHDDGERRRMMELIDVFREKSILDELGLGTIRDTFSEHFFPGTSTIQTRARYFLFVPWIYRQIENEHVPSHRTAARVRELQWKLVQSLKAGGVGDSQGVIGYEAGENLQRLPGSIYWWGLRRWGIRRFDGSIEQYHASLDKWYLGMRAPRSSDGGELLATGHHNWRETLPLPPPGWLEATDFAIRLEEAEFMLERIQQECQGTLLAAVLHRRITRVRSSSAPWDLGGLHLLDAQLQQDIEDARMFSLGMLGASRLYNLMIVQLQEDQGLVTTPGRVARFRASYVKWANEASDDLAALQAWDRTAMWSRLLRHNPRIRPNAIRFSDAYSAADDDQMRDLIRRRERLLKGSLARLSNPRALEKWSGAPDGGRMLYRWLDARSLVVDILDGMKQPAEVS